VIPSSLALAFSARSCSSPMYNCFLTMYASQDAIASSVPCWGIGYLGLVAVYPLRARRATAGASPLRISNARVRVPDVLHEW
jgi:hypothetical protein